MRRLASLLTAAVVAVAPIVTAAGPAAAVSYDGNRRDVVAVVGTDQQLWVRYTDGGWSPLGGRLVETPTVVALPPASQQPHDPPLWFFGTGGDGNVWVRSLSKGWQPFGPTGTRCSGISAARSLDTVAVGCRGGDGALYVAKVPAVDGALPSVGGWGRRGGQLGGGVAVVDDHTSYTGPHFTYATVGTDHRPWYSSDSVGWAAMTENPGNRDLCGGVLSSSPDNYRAFACKDYYSAGLKTFHPASGRFGYVIAPSQVTGRPGVSTDPDDVARYYVVGGDGTVWLCTQAPGGTTSGFGRFGGSALYGVAVASLTA